jgi:phosphoglycolate phosphatase-like HAD superfamily hydrolase
MEKIGAMTFLGLREMPYASEILDGLNEAGYQCVCLTNKSQKSAEEILAKLGLDKKLRAIIGTKLIGPHKPSKEFTSAAAEKVGADAASSIMIGDSVYDYQTAQNFGMPCVLVATGGTPIEELKELCPDAAGIYPNMKAIVCEFFKLE